MIVKALMKTLHLLNFESIYILGTESTKEETASMAKLHGLQKCYYDYDALLNSDVDTIYVALPNHLHYDFAKRALLKNKHVIIEKPITTNLTELQELVQLAEQTSNIIVEAMNIHYLPAYQSLRHQLTDIGDIKREGNRFIFSDYIF